MASQDSSVGSRLLTHGDVIVFGHGNKIYACVRSNKKRTDIDTDTDTQADTKFRDLVEVESSATSSNLRNDNFKLIAEPLVLDEEEVYQCIKVLTPDLQCLHVAVRGRKKMFMLKLQLESETETEGNRMRWEYISCHTCSLSQCITKNIIHATSSPFNEMEYAVLTNGGQFAVKDNSNNSSELIELKLKNGLQKYGKFTSLSYGHHPMTLLFACGKVVQRVDLRESVPKQELNYSLPAYAGESISIVQRWESDTNPNPFGVILITKQRSLIYDSRVVSSSKTIPLLSHSFELSTSPCCLSQNMKRVAICGSKYEDLMVFSHGCSPETMNCSYSEKQAAVENGRLVPSCLNKSSLFGSSILQINRERQCQFYESIKTSSDIPVEWSTKK
eukprot:CAMPEP_0204822248 /NCGR_PEP_ID=MMETSP1346-20131115/436_1 /ASSEMBLY_ACC=CAM_ASM_000771 /TAXON_ID=215587 /ORGANISM="Aplanochytrium stocchinoi, Strain GSBS06" /LENGTH=387 /DNA_ID=CAMNT_0051948351 /DNA_START=112 /DNA_END=1275 /DNA_ORIENTATION=+